MTKTTSKSLPASLLIKLDKHSIELIESYITRRKISDAYNDLKTQLDHLTEDELGTLVSMLNRAYLDGDLQGRDASDNDSELH